MKVLHGFNIDQCREHLNRNPDGAILITTKDDLEFSITSLDDPTPGSSMVSAIKFPDRPIRFDSATVSFSMLLPRDPRQSWRENVAEVSISTRQRRRQKCGVPNEQLAAA